MEDKSPVYYGYSKTTYKECKELIDATNRKHVEIVTLWFALVNLFFSICSWFNVLGQNSSRAPLMIAFTVLPTVFFLILTFLKKFVDRFFMIFLYLNITMLMVYGILNSISQPYMVAVMYPVLMVICALSYIDNMIKISISLMVFTAIFLQGSFSMKPESIAFQDTYNITVFLVLALVFHYSFQHARIRQFETYQKNIQIQRELEVQSSFDALTSLLNRARFFSMASQVLRSLTENEYVAVGLLDLDGFKQINDTLGHQMGDKVIQIAGEKILESIGIDESEKWSFPERAISNGYSFAGRLGGDEFIVFIRGMKNSEEIRTVMGKLLSDLNGVRLEDINGIQASIGVLEIRKGDNDIDKIYSRVDSGLYESKKQGKNRITFC